MLDKYGLSRLVRWMVGGIAVGAFLALFTASVIALIAFYPVGPYPSEFGIGSLLLAALCMMATAAMLALSGLLLSVFRRSWRPLGLALAAILGLVIGYLPASSAYDALRWHGYKLLSTRSAPLISAIEAYEHANGAPPQDLSQLVPAFIDAIPPTGMAKSPRYRYTTTDQTCAQRNRWQLSVPAGDFIGFDLFFYCPLQDYSSRFKRIGSWAYYFD